MVHHHFDGDGWGSVVGGGVVGGVEDLHQRVEGPLGVEDAAVAEPASVANEVDAGQIGLGIDTQLLKDLAARLDDARRFL